MKRTRVLAVSVWTVCILSFWSRADVDGSLACGVTVMVHAPETQLGSNMVWTTTLINNSANTQTCIVSRTVNAMLYNGKPAGLISNVMTTSTLNPGETNAIDLVVTPFEYSRFAAVTDTFQMDTVVESPNPQDIWFAPMGGRIVLSVSHDILVLAPQTVIGVGNCVTATVSYLNPHPVPLTGVKVQLSGSDEFSSNGCRIVGEICVGDVNSNGYVNASTSFVARSVGTGIVWAMITASNLMHVSTSTEIEITQ